MELVRYGGWFGGQVPCGSLVGELRVNLVFCFFLFVWLIHIVLHAVSVAVVCITHVFFYCRRDGVKRHNYCGFV